MIKKYLLGLCVVFSAYSITLEEQKEIFRLFKKIARNNPDALNKLGWHFHVAHVLPVATVKEHIPEKYLEQKNSRLSLVHDARSIFNVGVVFDDLNQKYIFQKKGLGCFDTHLDD